MNRLSICLASLAGLVFAASNPGAAVAQDTSFGCTKYVNIATGRGKKATFEKPAKDLGNIISRLEAGDVVCIAEGVYTGRGDNGADSIEIPVTILGGFNQDFTLRDPWGAHRTIFTGVHNSDNFDTGYRLSIDTSKFATALMEVRDEPTEHTVMVDGIVIDNGPRNYYRDDTESGIVRLGTPSDTPTPESGGLVISTGVNSTVIVQNVVVTNTAPTQGAFAFFPGRAADVTIRNNVAVNNTGAGFHLAKGFAGDDAAEYPTYLFENNMSIFNEKHDAFSSYGGSGIILESATNVVITNSIFAMNDAYGVDNAKRAAAVEMIGNLIFANAVADYLEFDLKMGLDEIEDESDLMDDASDNSAEIQVFEVSQGWAAKYAARQIIDRNAAEADVEAVDAWYNDLRSILGMNLVGTDLDVDSAVWLPRMSLEDVFQIARLYSGQYGVNSP
jgi:hypothetical protein